MIGLSAVLHNVIYCICIRTRQWPRYRSLPEGTLEGEGLYLIVYPESSPNTDGTYLFTLHMIMIPLSVSCAILYCTVTYCTVLYCTVTYGNLLNYTVTYCTVLYWSVTYCVRLYNWDGQMTGIGTRGGI